MILNYIILLYMYRHYNNLYCKYCGRLLLNKIIGGTNIIKKKRGRPADPFNTKKYLVNKVVSYKHTEPLCKLTKKEYNKYTKDELRQKLLELESEQNEILDALRYARKQKQKIIYPEITQEELGINNNENELFELMRNIQTRQNDILPQINKKVLVEDDNDYYYDDDYDMSANL
jgi:hypothetical protein